LFEESDQRLLGEVGKQPGARGGVHQGLEAVREQIGHAAGAAIYHVVMDRMGVAAGELERREHRRGLGAARDHEALAELEILEPALLRHHAMLVRIELGHGGAPALSKSYRYRRGAAAAIGLARCRRAFK